MVVQYLHGSSGMRGVRKNTWKMNKWLTKIRQSSFLMNKSAPVLSNRYWKKLQEKQAERPKTMIMLWEGKTLQPSVKLRKMENGVFKYLGSCFSVSAQEDVKLKMSEGLKNRSAVHVMINVWSVDSGVMMEIYQRVVISKVAFGADTGDLRMTEINKLGVMEMKGSRSLCGIARTYYSWRNESVMRIVGVRETMSD